MMGNTQKIIVAMGMLAMICWTALMLKSPSIMWAIAAIPVTLGILNQKTKDHGNND